MKRIVKDGTTRPFKRGDKVLYIPNHKLTGPKSEMVDVKNLGVVSSKNDGFVFVCYDGHETANATRPNDLYSIHNRMDLIDLVKIPERLKTTEP